MNQSCTVTKEVSSPSAKATQLVTQQAEIGEEQVVWHTLGDSTKPPLLLSPANGFPAASYHFFLQRFAKDYSPSAIENRGAWPDQPVDPEFGWRHHAEDFVRFLKWRGGEPVTAMGHSLGGAIVLQAAARHPDLFSGLVLIDPALPTSRSLSWFMQMAPYKFKRRIPFIQRTARRTNYWSHKKAFFDGMRSKDTYSNFSDEALTDYTEHGLENNNGEYRLVYPPEWEAHNFCRIDLLWSQLAKVSVPVLFLRAENTYMSSRRGFMRAASKLPDNIVCKEIPGIGHLAPQENPDLVAQYITDWLEVVA